MSTAPAVVPSCPIHNRAMKMGKFGYYCSTLVHTQADGTKVFCDQKVKLPKAQASTPAAPGANQHAPRIVTSDPPDLRAKLAALSFAENVYRGTGNPGDALTLAKEALKFLTEGAA